MMSNQSSDRIHLGRWLCRNLLLVNGLVFSTQVVLLPVTAMGTGSPVVPKYVEPLPCPDCHSPVGVGSLGVASPLVTDAGITLIDGASYLRDQDLLVLDLEEDGFAVCRYYLGELEDENASYETTVGTGWMNLGARTRLFEGTGNDVVLLHGPASKLNSDEDSGNYSVPNGVDRSFEANDSATEFALTELLTGTGFVFSENAVTRSVERGALKRIRTARQHFPMAPTSSAGLVLV